MIRDYLANQGTDMAYVAVGVLLLALALRGRR